jgi:protein Xni
MPEALAIELAALRTDLERTGIHTYEMSDWEADDVIATVADRAARSGLQVTILSTDKGFCQLVSERISVLNHFDRLLWDEETVRQRWGLAPDQLTDYWALCGDQTNHLPGVPGIGKKGAAQVLDVCGSLDRAIGWPDALPERQSTALGKGVSSAIRTRVLATLRTDLELGIRLSSLRAKS